MDGLLCLPCKMVAGAIRTQESSEDAPIREEMQKQRAEHAKNQKHDYSHAFRKKTRLELMRLSCIIVGIEFAYSAETAFVSPTLLEIGIQHKHMTMVWSLSPILGFLLAPLMGSLSDRCTLAWGRRRPLIFGLSIFIFFGLILVSWGKNIGSLLGDNILTQEIVIPDRQNLSQNLTKYVIISEAFEATPTHFYKWAAVITVLGTILLDFSADNCQTPARTYLLDVCVSDDHTKGLSTFTIMAGFGGFLGYSLGGINWADTQIGELMGGNVKTVFSIVTIIFLISSAITLTSFREIPLPLMENDYLLKPISQDDVKKERLKTNRSVYTVAQNVFLAENIPSGGKQKNYATHNCISDMEKQLGNTHANDDNNNGNNGAEQISLGKYLKSVLIMPKSMKILCFTNLLSWMGHTSYCLYFTDFVGEAVFFGDPTAPMDSPRFLLYQSGLRFGCWGLAIYALSCAIYSMTIERFIRTFGLKIVYISGLFCFGVGMMVLAIYPTKLGVLLLSMSAGIVYATVFTIPYLLIANYHASGTFKLCLGESVPLKQSRGLGTDVAVLSSMMFVAQIIVSLSIGPVITLVGSTNAVIYSASILSLCAAISATFVMYLD